MATTRNTGNRIWLFIFGGLFFVVLLLVVIPALFAALTPVATAPGPGSVPAPEQGVSVRDIVNSPDRFNSQVVTVSGQVGTQVGDSAFTIQDPSAEASEQVLVIGAVRDVLPADALAGANAPVEVVGRVRPLDLATLQQQLNYELDVGALAPYEGQPVILADSIQTQEGR